MKSPDTPPPYAVRYDSADRSFEVHAGSTFVATCYSEPDANFVAAACNNLGPVIAALTRLRNCPDLCLDSLEPETLAAIEEAETALLNARLS